MRNLVFALTVLLSPAPALASAIETAISDAELRGKAVFRFVGLPIYEARLFTPSGAPLDWSSDFGLELNYLRNLSGEDLVDNTMSELERIGTPMPVQDQFARCFKDVRKGDRYLAVTRGQNKIGFWRNGSPVCTVSHPRISQRFMAIFLGDNTRSGAFTRKLKGE
ncbi:hypothetical protein [Primorskyibacter sp. S87]|uniref:hypothetical protein n=1 Tax=Primorskyibacter sp. S87 TaxID=3415126 RepID=UPI003C7A7DC0